LTVQGRAAADPPIPNAAAADDGRHQPKPLLMLVLLM
jgi:hypothetical protein